MTVFIANFGQGNYLWPDCLRRGTVATVENVGIHRFWEVGDREGYVEYAMRNLKTVLDKPPIRPVASRWFTISSEISQTSNDVWVHREKSELWWTVSNDQPVEITRGAATAPQRDGPEVFVLHKPCAPWSDRTRTGARLSWSALHPKARQFLFTEGTLQRLRPENAAYALALINGDDLGFWHSQLAWKAVQAQAKQAGGIVYDAWGRTAYRMVHTALATVANANGQMVERVVKHKQSAFRDSHAFEAYVRELLKEQDNCCALSGLPLEPDGQEDDPDLRSSLDRIDSSGDYAPGNLQIVCRFINRWKSDSDDDAFRRLLNLLRAEGPGT